MSYRVLIIGRTWANREPLWPVSNYLSERDAHRFARDWLEQFPNEPVRVVPNTHPVAAVLAY